MAGTVITMQTFFRHLLTLSEVVLVALAVPIAILVVGAPIALAVRLLLEAVQAL